MMAGSFTGLSCKYHYAQMNIYVYVDDILIPGDDAECHILISEFDSLILEKDEELTQYIENHRRLNIYVESGFKNGQFSSETKELLQCYYNIYHNGDGGVFLGCNGTFTDISDEFI